MWPWPLILWPWIFEMYRLSRDKILKKTWAKFEQNRTIRVWVIDDCTNCTRLIHWGNSVRTSSQSYGPIYTKFWAVTIPAPQGPENQTSPRELEERHGRHRVTSAEGARIEALKAQSIVGNGKGWKRFCSFLGALVRLLLQYLWQILHFPANFEAEPCTNLDVYQRPAWRCRTHVIRLKRCRRSSGSILRIFFTPRHSPPQFLILPSPFSFPISSSSFHLGLYPLQV